MNHMNRGESVHGLLAEFASPAGLVQAVRAARSAGYRQLEAYAPMPVAGLAEAFGSRDGRLPRMALVGGLVGGVGAYLMQWLSATLEYPLNIGDRTPAWPGLIPATFEMLVLGAALVIFFGTLRGSRLPRLYHPVFNDSGFAAASSDRFFLCIEAADPEYESERTREFLESLQALRVAEVEV
jgi:hypothetical protein